MRAWPSTAVWRALFATLLLPFSPSRGMGRCLHKFPNDCNPTSITDQDICNFHRVDSDLYRGARPKCSGYAKLASLGIRTIISLEGSLEASLGGCEVPHDGSGAALHLVSLPISYPEIALTGVPDKNMRRIFEQIRSAPKPIFVTCRVGKDRTGVIVAVYRMWRQEMSFDEARHEALHYRFSPSLLGLNKTLNRYRDSEKVKALPTPARSAGPARVCMPDLALRR